MTIGNFFFSNTGAAYEIEQSLRFDGSSTSLTRTPSNSTNTNEKGTLSFWVKCLPDSGTNGGTILGAADTYYYGQFFNERFYFGNDTSYLDVAGQRRDPSAWNHVVYVFDTTLSTANDRTKIYVNGIRQTDTGTYNTQPSQNSSFKFLNTTQEYQIGRRSGSSVFLDGYLAEFHFVDGQALDPEDFGEFDNNGVWRPIKVNLTGPNNGTTWSTYLTDSSGSFQGSYPATKAFNGIASASETARASTTNTTSTFEPPTDISYTSSVEVWTYYAGSVSLNGGAAVSVSNDQDWRTIATGSGTLDTLTFTSSSSSVYVAAIRIDGVTLIDNVSNQYGYNGFYLDFDQSGDNPTINNGTIWSSYLTDSSGSFQGSYPATNAFNSVISATSTARASASNTTTTFQPPTDISYTSSVEVWTYYAGSVSLNGGSAVSVNNDQFWRTIATGSGSLDTLTFTSSSSSNVYLAGIRIDGVILIDGGGSAIGRDLSGNRNHWTPNSFLTAGAATDVMSDTPTTNYCTLNPAFKNINTGNTYTEGNLVATNGTGGYSFIYNSTIPVSSGKWYAECRMSDYTGSPSPTIGIQDAGNKTDVGNELVGAVTGDVGYDLKAGKIYKDGNYSYATGYTTAGDADTIGIKLDLDNDNIEFFKNNVSVGSSVPIATGTGLKVFAGGQGDGSASIGCKFTWNFGQREFAYPPGTASATSYFNTVTYTGDGSTQSITGVGFQPDLVWIKGRSNGTDHYLADSIRGAYAFLSPDGTGSQNSTTTYDPMSSFDSDGFTVRYTTTGGSTQNYTNGSGRTYVAWCWKAGGTASSNTDGSVTTSVSANTTAGFSVVTYTSQSSGPITLGHGLDEAPSMIITKNRDRGGTSWGVYHSAIGATKTILLDSSGDTITSSAYYNNTAPTSTVFTVNSDNVAHNPGTSDAYVAYCFSEKSGISKFGSYTGNGSSTGPFVECGFKPRFVMLKRTDAASNWFMYDTIRGTNNKLYADVPGAENSEDGGSTSSNTILSLSSGFQLTSSNGSNQSGGTYIFMAFAENFSADDTYKALNTANLPAPEIKDGSDYFNTVLYTGNGSNASATQAITGVGFQPDLVFIKGRSVLSGGFITDAVRGASNRLSPNTQNPENTSGDWFSSFDTDGFTVKGDANNSNASGETFAAWNWLAGNSTSTNTAGSISGTVTVSVNASAGFSIVTYNGSAQNDTVGHGLGVAPSLIIFKRRNNTTSWPVYHSAIGPSNFVQLNETTASSSSGTSFGSTPTAPTSTVFSVGDNGGTNYGTMVAYCFAEVEGYSKFGKYEGNGDSNGPFIYCGFKPAWVMFKHYSGTIAYQENAIWAIYDAKRDTYNVADAKVQAQSNAAESTSAAIDILSNGFKLRGVGDERNKGTGSYYLYVAFASNPFGGSGVSPATAR